MIKVLCKVGTERNILKLIKASTTILNGERQPALPLKSGTREGCPVSSLQFTIIPEALAVH